MQQEQRQPTCELRWCSERLEVPENGRRADDRKRDHHVEPRPHVMELSGRGRCGHRVTEARLLVTVSLGRMVGPVRVMVGTQLDVGGQLAHVTENENDDEQREEPQSG